MLVQVAKRLAVGSMKTDMGRTLTAVGVAALRSLEVEHGTRVNVNHSGEIGIRGAEECFDRVFASSETETASLPTGVVEGQVETPSLEEGPANRRINGDSG